MELEKAILKRRSVRSFKEKKASWKDILIAIEAALQAPFAGNNDHLSFVIVENQNKINKLAEQCEQLWMQEASAIVAVVSNSRILEHLYGERGLIYGRQQAGAAIQNFLLTITDIGLAACWVGAYDDDKVKSTLGAPEHIRVEALIPVGYENVKTKEAKVVKKRLENSVGWDSFGKKRRDFVFKEAPKHTTPAVWGEKGK